MTQSAPLISMENNVEPKYSWCVHNLGRINFVYNQTENGLGRGVYFEGKPVWLVKLLVNECIYYLISTMSQHIENAQTSRIQVYSSPLMVWNCRPEVFSFKFIRLADRWHHVQCQFPAVWWVLGPVQTVWHCSGFQCGNFPTVPEMRIEDTCRPTYTNWENNSI